MIDDTQADENQTGETTGKKIKRRKIVRRVVSDPQEDDNTLLWISISVGAVILTGGGITAVLVIRRKKNRKGGH